VNYNYYVVSAILVIIQDPSPEVVDYFSVLPNSEAELDHALLPLPLYPSSKYPIIRLDPVVSHSYLVLMYILFSH